MSSASRRGSLHRRRCDSHPHQHNDKTLFLALTKLWNAYMRNVIVQTSASALTYTEQHQVYIWYTWYTSRTRLTCFWRWYLKRTPVDKVNVRSFRAIRQHSKRPKTFVKSFLIYFNSIYLRLYGACIFYSYNNAEENLHFLCFTKKICVCKIIMNILDTFSHNIFKLLNLFSNNIKEGWHFKRTFIVIKLRAAERARFAVGLRNSTDVFAAIAFAAAHVIGSASGCKTQRMRIVLK